MKNLSIRFLSYIILSIIAVYGVFVIYSAFAISSANSKAEQFWTEYQDISSVRASAYNSIVQALGYGELVHQYNTYILRKDERRLPKIRVSIGKVHAAISQYTKTVLTPPERSALRDIRSVVRLYARNINKARRLARDAYSSRQIVKVASVDDAPAIAGLAVLRQEVIAHKLQDKDRIGRVELLAEFHRALGFGGMIHTYQSYILRQDKKQVVRARAAIKEVETAIDRYRGFSLAPAEDLALNSLLKVVQEYKVNLEKAVKLVADDMAPEEIDWKLKVDDAPALSALRILQRENNNLLDKSKKRTTDRLESTTAMSWTIMLASAIGLALLIALIAHVLFSHVLGPVNKLSKSLSQFVEGDLNVEFHGTQRQDELGYLANIVDKMRLILLRYAMSKSS